MLRNSALLLALCWLLTACDAACLVEKQVSLPQAAWHKDSLARLTLPVNDTLVPCAILLTLRHSDAYPYRNIILSVRATSPLGATVKDTVEYLLVDEQEAWYGKTGGKWIDHRLAFRTGVQFLQPGEYRFEINHLMRQEALQGVGAIGIRIEKTEN